jgi:ribosomal protein S11
MAIHTKALAHIQAGLSNTLISITDTDGNVLAWCSSGSVGFEGSRRSTNYAAQATAENAARKAVQLGIQSVEVRIQGLGFGKESALSRFYNSEVLPSHNCVILPEYPIMGAALLENDVFK